MSPIEAFATTLPVFLMILLGVVLRATRFIRSETVEEIKKLVVTVTLPLVLGKAFASMQFQARYLVIVALVFVTCTLITLVSRLYVRKNSRANRFLPFLMAGFEAGMMGYAIFGAVFGVEHISKFAVIDLGQVLFVFFVLIPDLQRGPETRTGIGGTLLSVLSKPVIIGILTGLVLNLSGIYQWMTGWSISAAVIQTVTILGGLTTPLVALVLGYELHIQPGNLAAPFRTVATRMAIWIAAGLALNFWVIDRLLGLDRLFQAAVMIMFVLPAAFVIPLYLGEARQEDRDYILNTISIGTLASLAAVVVIRMAYTV